MDPVGQQPLHMAQTERGHREKAGDRTAGPFAAPGHAEE